MKLRTTADNNRRGQGWISTFGQNSLIFYVQTKGSFDLYATNIPNFYDALCYRVHLVIFIKNQNMK